ncbi:TetR/AcrR family transcriptional regulator [Steroidobacter flavus]|uniref:TetR/AcrR family transcriptional regulator n=1 Tax=Steroidobacter flavus TaxID=1842136 RepID=A0ABV8SWS8_9GAMM
MMQKTKSEKRARLTQAERSAATRKVLLEASVKCLFEHGYGQTTTILIADIAGISRGALLHQFPSKADLMAYVVEAVFEEETAMYRELLRNVSDPDERMVAYAMAAWKIQSRPPGVAVLEILQGSRSDKVLAEKLKPVEARIEDSAKAILRQEMHRNISPPLFRLMVGVIRGLSIQQVIAPEGEDVTEAVKLLQRLLRAGIETGVIGSKAKAAGKPLNKSAKKKRTAAETA